MTNVAQMIRYFIDYIREWRITMEKASDNDFFPILQSEKLLLAAIIYSLRQSNVNLSGDPRRELIRELKIAVIAPVSWVHPLYYHKQNTSKTVTNFTKCRT